MPRGRFMTKLFGDGETRSYPSSSYIKHQEKKPASRPDEEQIKALVVSLKIARTAISEAKYDLAKNILASLIENVESPLDCPVEYRPPSIDEADIKSKVSTLRSIRTCIIGEKYGLAANITASFIDTVQAPLDCPPIASVPRIVDQQVIDSIIEKLDIVHDHAKSQMFHLGARIIVSLLESQVNDEDFITAAIQHHLSEKRCLGEERWYLANNYFTYEEVLKLRPNDKMIQGIFKNCKDVKDKEDALRGLL